LKWHDAKTLTHTHTTVEAGYKEEREVAFLRITSLEQQKEPLQKEAEVHI